LKIEKVQISASSTEIRHLYVHIPFCAKICPYCNFYKTGLSPGVREDFVKALALEASRCADRMDVRPATIFFGGGTPTALTTKQLSEVCTMLHDTFRLDAVEEWTVEMNPATVSAEKARMLLDHGVNRMSMGVQAWQPHLLKVLGRVHSSEQALRSYSVLREAGVSNVNLDLMFGVPGQTPEDWAESLDITIGLAPEHISAYSLTYEEDTEFFRQQKRGLLHTDAEIDAGMFELAMSALQNAGYEQYEISNHAKPGRACAHNMAYWLGADYLGLGPGAVSTLGKRRRTNAPDTAAYTRCLIDEGCPPAAIEPLEPALRQREILSFLLRTSLGLDPVECGDWRNELEEYQQQGWLQAGSSGRWCLTTRGKMVADALAEVFW